MLKLIKKRVPPLYNCPYCQKALKPEAAIACTTLSDDMTITATFECTECHKPWRDMFVISDIELIETIYQDGTKERY